MLQTRNDGDGLDKSLPPRMCAPSVWTVTTSLADWEELDDSSTGGPAQMPPELVQIQIPFAPASVRNSISTAATIAAPLVSFTVEIVASKTRKLTPNWLRTGLGVTKDCLKAVNTGIGFGYGVFRQNALTAFAALKTTASSAAEVLEKVGTPAQPVSKALKMSERIIQGVQNTTLTSAVYINTISHISLEMTSAALTKFAGAQEGELFRLLGKTIGREEFTEAMHAVIYMFYSVFSECSRTNISFPQLLMAARTFSTIQAKCRAKDIPGVPIDMDCLPMLGRFMRFAMGSYGYVTLKTLGSIPLLKTFNNQTAICYVTGIKPSDILAEEWTASIYKPAWYLARDTQTKSVVLTFRGTSSVEDTLTDLICEAVACNIVELATPTNPEGKGYCHKGFLTSANKMSEKLYPIVKKALEENEGYRLILCGHSLGAAVAAMVTVLWIPAFPNLHCYAYAQPCVLSQELSVAAQPYVTALLHGDDFVPRFGLGTFLDLRAALIRLVGDKSLRNNKEYEQTMEKPKKEEMTHHKLFPCGTLLYVHPASSSQKMTDKRGPFSPLNCQVYNNNDSADSLQSQSQSQSSLPPSQSQSPTDTLPSSALAREFRRVGSSSSSGQLLKRIALNNAVVPSQSAYVSTSAATQFSSNAAPTSTSRVVPSIMVPASIYSPVKISPVGRPNRSGSFGSQQQSNTGRVSPTESVQSGTSTVSSRTAWVVEPQDFEGLVLSHTMFSAHLPSHYLNALKFLPEADAKSPTVAPQLKQLAESLSASPRSIPRTDSWNSSFKQQGITP